MHNDVLEMLHLPFGVRRRSALSGLREVRNSARLVNMR